MIFPLLFSLSFIDVFDNKEHDSFEWLDDSLAAATAAQLAQNLLSSPLDGLLGQGPEHGDVGDVDGLDEGGDDSCHGIVEAEEDQHAQRHINCTDDNGEGTNTETIRGLLKKIFSNAYLIISKLELKVGLKGIT